MVSLPQRPFLLGILVGPLLVLLPMVTLGIVSDLDQWFQGGSAYGLMPLFVLAGLLAFRLTYVLRPRIEALGERPLHLTHGILLSTWVVGAALMWATLTDLPPLRRITAALTGSVLVVAFWLWLGSLLAHALPPRTSGVPQQTQGISSRAR